MKMMMHKDIEHILEMISYQKSRDISFGQFFDKLASQWNLIIIGGSLRDALNQNYNPRDIDIILNGNDMVQFELMLSQNSISFKKNRFDGYKLKFNHVEVDVWSINRHFAFGHNYYSESIENIVETTFLNYDSIAFDYNKKKLYKDYYDDCRKSHLIELIGDDNYIDNNPTPDVNIARMLKIKEDTGYDLSSRSISYIKKYYMDCLNHSVSIEDQLRKGYQSHYRKQIDDVILFYLNEIIER